ncbi:hypothetical protein U9M48_022384 [Paspalum notatum var. saurae]|uniref:Uncharacterized protein n=1 Tax=Paspalum notatum var. saurae TaxID=547442 RepID=A0AAQ3WUQ0_PASNO
MALSSTMFSPTSTTTAPPLPLVPQIEHPTPRRSSSTGKAKGSSRKAAAARFRPAIVIMKTRGLYHRCRGMLCMTNNDQGCMPPIYSNMALLYKNGLIITQAFICKKKWLIHFKYLSLNHGVDLLESIQSDPKKDSTKN